MGVSTFKAKQVRDTQPNYFNHIRTGIVFDYKILYFLFLFDWCYHHPIFKLPGAVYSLLQAID